VRQTGVRRVAEGKRFAVTQFQIVHPGSRLLKRHSVRLDFGPGPAMR
jgi:hypothetical protein